MTVYCEHCQEDQLSFSIHHHWDTWQRSRFLDVRRGRIVLCASAPRLSIWQYIHNWICDELCEPDICDINKYGTTERDDHENNHSDFVINITAFRDADCQNVNKYDKNEEVFFIYLFSIQTFREVKHFFIIFQIHSPAWCTFIFTSWPNTKAWQLEERQQRSWDKEDRFLSICLNKMYFPLFSSSHIQRRRQWDHLNYA